MDSDPEVVLVDKVDEDEISTDKDSGMESAGNSKDDTPERKTATVRITVVKIQDGFVSQKVANMTRS